MSIRQSIFRGATFRLIGQFVALGLSFLITPFIISQIGQESYGLWLLLLSVVYMTRFMDLGLSSAVQREIALAVEKKGLAQISEIVSCAAALFLVLALFGGALVVVIAYYPSVLGVGEEYRHTAKLALLMLSIKVLWDLAMCSIHGFFAGFLKFEIDANIQTLNELVRAALVVALVGTYKMYGLVIAVLLADLLCHLLKLFYVKKIYPGIEVKLRLVSRVRIKELYNYSKHVLVMVIGKHFNSNVDTLILSHLLGLQFVAIYGVVRRLVTLTEGIYLAILGMFMPILTRLIERKADVHNEMYQLFSLNLFLVAALFSPIIALANWFMQLWLGPGYELAQLIVFCFALAMMCHCISRPIDSYFLARAAHARISMISLLLLFSNVAISLLFGWLYGLVGVLAGTVVSNYLCQFMLKLYLYKKHSQAPVSKLLARFVVANLLMVSFGYGGSWLVSKAPPEGWIMLFLYGGIIFSIAIASNWLLLLTANIRQMIFSTVETNLKKVLRLN